MLLLYVLYIVLIIPLFPFLLFEGLRVQKKVKKLPEAEGKSGITQLVTDKQKNILFIGESAMAGVGISNHKNGFAGSLSKELSDKLKINIKWNVYAKRGYTVKELTREIIPEIKPVKYDLIIIGIGANDTFALRNPLKWRIHVFKMIAFIKFRIGNVPIAFINIPPVNEFPAFSKLMRFILGKISSILRITLTRSIKNKPNIYFNSNEIKISKWLKKYKIDELFSDGVHPSKLTYRLWAKDFSEYLLSKRDIKVILSN